MNCVCQKVLTLFRLKSGLPKIDGGGGHIAGALASLYYFIVIQFLAQILFEISHTKIKTMGSRNRVKLVYAMRLQR